MERRTKPFLLLILYATSISGQWSPQWPQTFDYLSCYQNDPSQRMPNTLQNLIGLLYKYENGVSNYISPDNMAEMLLHRYRKDGVAFSGTRYSPSELVSRDKGKLIEKLIRSSQVLIPNAFDTREECSLHFMLSHSIDDFPHMGVDQLWDGTITYNQRRKRQAGNWGTAFNAGGNSAFNGGYGGQSNNGGFGGQNGAGSNAQGSSGGSGSGGYGQHSHNYGGSLGNSLYPNMQSRAQYHGYTQATHPLENGVMETPYGPVAAGTLLAGLSVMNSQSSISIRNLLDQESLQRLPSEIWNQAIKPMYAATLSGDIGEMALSLMMPQAQGFAPSVGPAGRYHNCTTCARLYSLQNHIPTTTLTRAEMFAGIDALLIKKAYDNGMSNYGLSLAQILKFYYSEQGLPGAPDHKACNRLELYSSLDDQEIQLQALFFMYAFQEDFPYISDTIEIHKQNFPDYRNKLKTAIAQVHTAITNFISSYQNDDEGNPTCQTPGQVADNNYPSPMSQTVVDAIFVYNENSPTTDATSNRQLIGDVARRLRQDAVMTTVGVLSYPSGNWLYPPQNFSNIGDWACNFTADYSGSSDSGSVNDGIDSVYSALTTYYSTRLTALLTDDNSSGNSSQVVVWEVGGAPYGDASNANETIYNFRLAFPDVRVLRLGSNRSPFQGMLEFDDDFVTSQGLDLRPLEDVVLDRLMASPRSYVYPACHFNDTSLMTSYDESSHVYQGSVSPNYTTYIEVPARLFQLSESVSFTVTDQSGGSDVYMCASRTNRFANQDYQTLDNEAVLFITNEDDPLQCNSTITYDFPCDMYLMQCNSIYLAISAANATSAGCNNGDQGCAMPGQITYQLSHEGLYCSGSSVLPTLALLLTAVLTQRWLV